MHLILRADAGVPLPFPSPAEDTYAMDRRWISGAVSRLVAAAFVAAGAGVLVAGSAVFGATDGVAAAMDLDSGMGWLVVGWNDFGDGNASS